VHIFHVHIFHVHIFHVHIFHVHIFHVHIFHVHIADAGPGRIPDGAAEPSRSSAATSSGAGSTHVDLGRCAQGEPADLRDDWSAGGGPSMIWRSKPNAAP
jgi:hypothetical protein